MRFLITILFACFLTSCSNFGSEDLQPITLASSSTDSKLLKTIEKNFTKTKVYVQEEFSTIEKSLKNLDSGLIDAYITSAPLPYVREDLESFLITKDGIAIVTNPANPVSDLYQYQLAEIFSSKEKSWRSYSKFNQPILVVDHDKTDLTRIALLESLFGSQRVQIATKVKVKSDKEVLESVKKFPNAISYVSFSELRQGLKTIDVDSIPANKKNMEKAYYPLIRNIRIYFKPSVLNKKNTYNALKELLEYIYSVKGQDLISSLGYMPLTSSELKSIQLEADPIYIGVAAPLDGSYTDLGKAIVSAAKLAVEDFNETEALDGRKVELLVCNDKADVSTAIACANSFVKEKVVAVIGHLTSQSSIEASKVYAEHHIVQITPASTHPWFTERPGARGYAFRTIGRDDRQAKLIASEIDKRNEVHPVKISIFHNDTIYANTLSSLIGNEVAKLDKDKVIETVALERGKTQYHKEVERLESQVLVFVGEYGDAAQIMKELALSNKKDIMFFGADGTFSQRFIDEAGLRAEQAYVTGSTIDIDSELTKKFMLDFKEQFKMDASAFAMNSYDAAQVILEALKKSHETGADLNEAVKSIRYQGVTGTIYFNELGDPVLPRMTMYQVQDGSFVRI